MKTPFVILSVILLVFAGCKSKQSDAPTENFITVDVTKNYPAKEMILQDFMDVEYIPLETSKEFITMAYIQAISEEVVIVRNRKQTTDGDIFFFDIKNGKGLKKSIV